MIALTSLAAAALSTFALLEGCASQPGSRNGGSGWSLGGGGSSSQSAYWSTPTRFSCGGYRYDMVSTRSSVYGYSEYAVRGRWLGSEDPTVCYSNVTRAALGMYSGNDSSMPLGYFVCPLPNDSDSLYCCCGSEVEQFCCSVSDYATTFYRTELLALASALTVLFLWGLSSLTRRKLRKPVPSARDAGISGDRAMQRSYELRAGGSAWVDDAGLASVNRNENSQYVQRWNFQPPPYEAAALPPKYEDAIKNPKVGVASLT